MPCNYDSKINVQKEISSIRTIDLKESALKIYIDFHNTNVVSVCSRVIITRRYTFVDDL